MSTVVVPPPEPAEPPPGAGGMGTRFADHLRAGGWFTSILTTIVAFFLGGLVVFVTGRDPLSTYNAIWQGTGLEWIFPWVTGADRAIAAVNLQQTLLLTTPLILTGLAVALAFRAGLFNIGGQGQYIAGTVGAVWVGSSFEGMPHVLHVILAILAALAGGALWGGIAGVLRATTGANEVITTIMLNWTALWVGRLPLQPGRATAERRAARRPGLQRRRARSTPARLLGRPRAAGPAHRPLHRARRGGLLRHLHPAIRRAATRRAPSASTRRRRATAASASGRRTSG